MQSHPARPTERILPFFAATNVGLAVQDTELRYVNVNETLAHMHGVAAEHHLGKTPREILPQFAPILEPILFAALTTGQPALDVEVSGETPARPGMLSHWIFCCFPWRDEQGRIGGIGSVTVDVTDRKRAEQRLLETEEQYRALFESSYYPMFIVDNETFAIMAGNAAAAALYGYPRHEFMAMTFNDLRALADSTRPGPGREDEGRPAGVELRLAQRRTHRTKEGAFIEVSLTRNSILFQGREATLILIEDVTERKRVEALKSGWNRVLDLLARDSRLEAVLTALVRAIEQECSGMLCSILLLDPEGRLQHAAGPSLPSDYTRALSGLEIGPGHGSCGTAAYRLEPVIVDDIATDPLWAESAHVALAHGLRSCWSQPILSASGQALGTFAQYYRDPRRASDADLEFMRAAANIAGMAIERKRALEQIQAIAYHDALTGLPNRRLFGDLLEHHLSQARRKQQTGVLLLLDLDHFKVVNDSLGHLAGDRLLQSVAERLKECVRDSDTVARMGGDEFMVLLPDIGQAADAAKIAQKILNVMAQPFRLSGQELVVAASIGLSLYPVDGTDGETLIKNADAALYRVKDQGRNHYQFWTSEMNVRATERLSMENSLRRALEQQQFVVYYQPQVDLGTGRIVGVESLVRWRHPEKGLVSPAMFIGVAEETGLIVPLGEWVLRTACNQAKEWEQRGYPLRVGVNLSVRQFRQRDLIHQVTEILRETGLAAKSLNLEITESLAMEDVESTITILQALGELGVQISIDDFGTGYSSLSYLKQLPINALKIDQSFVSGIGTNANDTAIVTALITMAHSLELKVIAEGVETEQQLAFLRAHRCEGMQGYLFSPPVPAERFEELLQEGRMLPV